MATTVTSIKRERKEYWHPPSHHTARGPFFLRRKFNRLRGVGGVL